MTNQTHFLPKAAALVAGAALVVTAFAPMAGAQTSTTTTTTTTTTAYAFTRDLTIGSTGPDVVALQTWLIAHGYIIPAGATGYFGTQTRAAVSAFQAANGIQPTAGYFGPITRGRILAMTGTPVSTVPGCLPGYNFSPTTGQPCTTTTPTIPGCLPGYVYSVTTGQPCTSAPSNNNDGSLSGGEANLTNFDLVSEEGTVNSNEGDAELATARFDVDDGDIEVQRAELDATIDDNGNASASTRPWNYFDQISVMADGKTIGHIDGSDRDNWDEQDNGTYRLTFNNLDYVVREGDRAELTFAADISDLGSDDQDASVLLDVPDDGIRAVDAAGIQQYTGDENDTVSVDFDQEVNGELTVRESSDNEDNGTLVADTNDTSDDQDVLSFEIRNTSDADTDIESLTFDVSTTAGGNLNDIINRATLTLDGDTYNGDVNNNGTITFDDLHDVTVDSNDSIDGVLSVRLSREGTSFNAGDTLTFSLDADTGVEAEGHDSGDPVRSGDLSGTVNSTQTITTTAVTVDPTSATSSTNNDSNLGTYSIKFNVTAGDDDLYIPKGAGTTNSSSNGVIYHITNDPGVGAVVNDDLTSSARTVTDSGITYYVVNAGDTEAFTLSVSIDPTVSNFYQVDLDSVRYGVNDYTSPALETVNVNDNDRDAQAGPEHISA